MRIALVVPTIRENCFRDFVERWNKIGLFNHVQLIVMEDNPTKTFDAEVMLKGTGKIATHLCWEDIDRDLKDKSWIIPRRSDTVRSYAYYYAWKYKYDYVLTLDDDVYPPNGEQDGVQYEDGNAFVQQHLKYLTGRTRWFNTLNDVKPRGIPFYNLGKKDNVVLNHGLWTNVLDYDAPTQLANPKREKFSYDNQLVPHGQYFPMCGMNLMFRRDIAVLMYHLLMGQAMPKFPDEQNWHSSAPPTTCHLKKLPFDRWGDIGCGIIMKKICDMVGFSVATGMPYGRHDRASNVFANLKKEAAVLEVNEKLWEYVDSFTGLGYGGSSLANLYEGMGVHIKNWKEYPEYEVYFKQLGLAMTLWADLFNEENL